MYQLATQAVPDGPHDRGVRRPPSAQRSLSPDGPTTAYDERMLRQGADGRAILVDVAACTRIP